MSDTSELGRMVNDYRLATAEILYRLPDHPGLLQSYVWQDYDIPPRFPTLQKFLGFWESNIEGRLHSVRVCSTRLLRPRELRHAQATFTLH